MVRRSKRKYVVDFKSWVFFFSSWSAALGRGSAKNDHFRESFEEIPRKRTITGSSESEISMFGRKKRDEKKSANCKRDENNRIGDRMKKIKINNEMQERKQFVSENIFSVVHSRVRQSTKMLLVIRVGIRRVVE